MNNLEYIQKIEKHLVNTYNRLPVVLCKGKGVWVWDVEGNRYLDMLSCYSADNAGHCHPEIVRAACRQIRTLDSVSSAFYNDKLLFTEEIARVCNKEKVLFMNVGMEAVERAIKIARKWGYTRKGIPLNTAEIIVCEDLFHGRSITLTGLFTELLYKKYFGPYTPGFVIIPYGDLEALERAINKKTAAFLAEPIQGEGGVIVPPEGYLRGAKEICQKNDVLFILDEIQTGLGRTGKLFAYQYEDAEPDVLVIGKFLGGGVYPVSAVAGAKEIVDIFEKGEDGSTFAGNPIALAVARATLKVLMEKRLWERAAKLGDYFLEELKKIRSPYIKEIRGKGLLIGLELKSAAGGARRFCETLKEEGLLCKETHTHIIRFMPPLVIAKKLIDWALEKIEKVLTIPSR